VVTYAVIRDSSVSACEDASVEPLDLDVRRHVYYSVVANGRPPTTAETAAGFDVPERDVARAYRRLHDAHALVLFPETTNVWMANPFCFAPTAHRVSAGGRVWTGTCAWDALGIPAALHCDGRIESECACCGERVTLEVREGELVAGTELTVHILLPARRWWEDIGFT
jgi:Alkylmercury lyase